MDFTNLDTLIFDEEVEDACNNLANKIYAGEPLSLERKDHYDNLSLSNIFSFRNNLYERCKNLDSSSELAQKYYSINTYFQERAEEFLIKEVKIEKLDNESYLNLNHAASCKIAEMQASRGIFQKMLAMAKSEGKKKYYIQSISYTDYQIFRLKEIIAATHDNVMFAYTDDN